jgi:ArsR family transcriptional regulator, arsenate/arsenite/antimonite-responsive transcriptional repressor
MSMHIHLVLECPDMAGAKKAFDMERFFQALGDRTRLRLLNLIGDDEICVCYFVESLGTNQPKVSRHLAYLRRAGVVAARREGKWMHYRIVEPADAHASRILRDTREWMAEDPEMQRDRARLMRACCAPKPVTLRRAPRPAIVSAGALS